MAKHEPTTGQGSAAEAAASPRGSVASTRRRIARLERKLHRLSGEEARRVRRLTRTRERAQTVERRLRELRAPAEAQAHAYCLRDRRIVPMLDPRPVVTANGRSAVSGTCQVCGGGVLILVARASAS